MKKNLVVLTVSLALVNQGHARSQNENVKYPGGESFNQCQSLATRDWKSLVKNSQDRNAEDKWNKAKVARLFKDNLLEAADDGGNTMLDKAKKAKERLEAAKTQDPNAKLEPGEIVDLETLKKNIISAVYTTYYQVQKCEFYLATTYNDYVDLDDRPESNSTASPDGAIRCTSKGFETQDYPACVRLVNTYVASVYGKQATNTAQQFMAMDHAMDSQEELMKNGTKDMTLGLKIQKDGLETQSNMAIQRGVVDAGFAVTMGKFISDMPTADNLTDDCIASGQSKALAKLPSTIAEAATKVLEGEEFIGVKLFEEQAIAGASSDEEGNIFTMNGKAVKGTEIAYGKEKLKKECTEFITSSEQYLLQNSQKGLDAAKQKMADLGMNALAEAGKAALLNKQASDIDGAIKKVDAFEPVDWTPPSGELTAAICEAEPNREGCLAPTFGRTSSYVDPGLSISGIGAGGVVNSGVDADSLAMNDPDSTAISDQAKNDFKVGSLAGSVDKSNQFESSAPGAATVKSGGANPGGAGGSGGSGAGGIGAPAPAKVAAEKGKSAFVGKAAKVSYAGDSKGSLGYSGGRGSAAKKASGNENPFDKLFGKKDSKDGNDVLNYRDLASAGIGGKNGSIFNRISTRYGQVQSKGRLLEYEEVK